MREVGSLDIDLIEEFVHGTRPIQQQLEYADPYRMPEIAKQFSFGLMKRKNHGHILSQIAYFFNS